MDMAPPARGAVDPELWYPEETAETLVQHMLAAGWVPVTDPWEKWQWPTAPEGGGLSRGAYYPFEFAFRDPFRTGSWAWGLDVGRQLPA
jgi:hypothetical protein